ncbi:MAG TPA: T9SS type A sorting domain-containing protein [Chitinophagales bacterium]|nr:T9SS type A sorting domain-containing protein [Chitinophagales bacterium]
MKKLLLATLASAALAGAHAQPTFTAATLPTIGQAYTTQVYDSVGINAGPSGANQTWTYTLTPTGAPFTQTYVSPASTPYAAQYPNATLATSDGMGSYSYQSFTSTELSFWGLYTPAYDLTYTDPMVYFTLPMSYTDTYTDDFEGSYTYGGGAITAERSGTHTVTYDAYGTLVLNGQTFSNVLRLHSHETYLDETTFSTTNTEVNTYSWYGAWGANMLLQISWTVADFGAGGIINSKSVTGMANPSFVRRGTIGNASFSLLNNVCNAGDPTTASFTSDRNQNATVQTVDALGRVVHVRHLTAVAGKNTVALQTNDLAAGVYLVRLVESNGQNVSAQKLIVQ